MGGREETSRSESPEMGQTRRKNTTTRTREYAMANEESRANDCVDWNSKGRTRNGIRQPNDDSRHAKTLEKANTRQRIEDNNKRRRRERGSTVEYDVFGELD
ncbi:hypothetical protein AB1N83_013762 [Pleurotus pulmonarius]